MREFKKYTSAMDYLMERNGILYQEVKDWMHLTAYEYNTTWYSMKAFQHFKKNAFDPDEDIRSIRMYADSESIQTAYALGKKLVKELNFQIIESSEFADGYFKYIGYLIKKYHIAIMTHIVSIKDHNAPYYVTGIRRPEDRIMKFEPTVAKMNKEKQAAFTSNSLTEEEKRRLYQAMMNVLLNRVNDEEQDKLIGQPVLSNRVYAEYNKFLNYCVYGLAYDVENEEVFRLRVLSLTDRKIYMQYNTAIEFCIQVYLLGLKTEFNEYVWSIPTYYAMTDTLVQRSDPKEVTIPLMGKGSSIMHAPLHWALPKEVKISRTGKDSSDVHESLYWALPDIPDSERKESE